MFSEVILLKATSLQDKLWVCVSTFLLGGEAVTLVWCVRVGGEESDNIDRVGSI